VIIRKIDCRVSLAGTLKNQISGQANTEDGAAVTFTFDKKAARLTGYELLR